MFAEGNKGKSGSSGCPLVAEDTPFPATEKREEHRDDEWR